MFFALVEAISLPFLPGFIQRLIRSCIVEEEEKLVGHLGGEDFVVCEVLHPATEWVWYCMMGRNGTGGVRNMPRFAERNHITIYLLHVSG